jgi:serine/threonine-protein kinase RsbW
VGVIHLRCPGTLRYRDLAVRVVGAACKLMGAGEDSGPVRINRDFDHQIISAFGEAFNNVAIHSYRGHAPGEVEVEVELGTSHVTVRLRDWGRSFAIDNVPLPDLDAMPESGLGLFIIRSFMDEVNYRPGSPNVLSMTKHLDPSLIAGSADRKTERAEKVDPTSRQAHKPADAFEDSAGGKSRQ